MENKNPYTDTVTRRYQNSDYEKTKEGWVKKIKETEEAAAQQASPADTKKEYTDEELAEYAKKASDEALRKAGAGRDERMRVAAKKEILRRKNEGMPEPERSDNPFDEGLAKGMFDEFPTKVFGGKEYINKGQGWEVLEKSRAAVGEIRVWSGEKYQKTATGWKYLGKASGNDAGAKEESKTKKTEKSAEEIALADALKEHKVTDEQLNALPTGTEIIQHDELSDTDVHCIKQEDGTWLETSTNDSYSLADYPDLFNHPDAKFVDAIIPEAKPAWDKDWPESVDKLTNRADPETIHAEAKKIAEAKVRAKYPTDEDFLKEQIESFEKNDWLKPFGWDGMTDEDKKKYADQSIRYQIAIEVRDMLGSSRYPISKTTQIANIKGAWRAMKQAERDAKAKSEYDAFLATNEGAAGEKALGEKIKSILDDWHKAENEIESQAIKGILDILKDSPTKSLVEDSILRIGRESLEIENRDYRGVQVNWRRIWDEKDKKSFTVQATGYGATKPGSIEAKSIILEAEFLMNEELQTVAKDAIEKYASTQHEYGQKMKELEKSNTKYDWETVYAKYSKE